MVCVYVNRNVYYFRGVNRIGKKGNFITMSIAKAFFHSSLVFLTVFDTFYVYLRWTEISFEKGILDRNGILKKVNKVLDGVINSSKIALI